MSLALGIATRDITPAPGLPMGGYAARTATAQATLDPLMCRAAVFRAEGRTVVLIVLDLLYVLDPWAAAVRTRIARRVGSETSDVMIAATHTHAGPAVFGAAMKQSAELAEYERHLAESVEAAVVAAAAAAGGVTLHYGAASTDAVAANRQDPQRRIDEQVHVVVARNGVDKPAGILASFGCHPTVLSAANLSYSRDLFGVAADVVAEETGAAALLFNGAAGDVSTRFTRRAQTPDEMQRLGRLLAAGILAAARDAEPIENTPIGGRSIEVRLEPRRPPSAKEASEQLTAAMKRCDEARGHVADAELRRLTADVEGAAAQLYFSQQGGVEALLGHTPDRAALQTLQIGGCDVLGVPGEMFSEVGRRVCASRSRPALLAGYANDYLGYLVPPHSPKGYESLMSFVTEASAAAIADALAGGDDPSA